MTKGKEHKKYEFGTKALITKTRDSNIIVGVLAFEENTYDGHTLPVVVTQVQRLLGQAPHPALCDRGYRGKSKVNKTRIFIPGPGRKNASSAMLEERRKQFRRRAGIEAVIGYLKSDYRLCSNYLKGIAGDQINLLMAAAAFNFSKLLRDVFYGFNSGDFTRYRSIGCSWISRS